MIKSEVLVGLSIEEYGVSGTKKEYIAFSVNSTLHWNNRIYSVYRKNVIRESTVRKWFSRLRINNFHFNTSLRSGRPSNFDKNNLNALLYHDVGNWLIECIVTNQLSYYICILWEKCKNWMCWCKYASIRNNVLTFVLHSLNVIVKLFTTVETFLVAYYHWWRQILPLCRHSNRKLWLSSIKKC